MQPWKTLSRTTILKHSKYLTVEDHTIELPDGRVVEHWPWLDMPDYAIVLPVTKEGDFLCFRQTKYGVEGTSLAPIGGYLDEGEDPLIAAKREMREETGFESSDWISLGHYISDGNHGAGVAHLFLARNARQVAARNADDLEEQQLLKLNKLELDEALANGEFKVLAWAMCIALALRHVG